MIDRAFGVFLLLLGLALFYGGLQLEVPFSYDPLGPKTFPMIIGGMLALLSVGIIAKPKVIEFPSASINLKTLLIVLLLIVYQGVFNLLGFLLSTTLLVFFLSKIFKGTTPQALGAGIGVSVVTYGLFSYLLEVPLPMGTIFTKLLGA
jgi:putative tricarboxylic transport membrane protein